MEVCKFFCSNDGVTVWGWGGYMIVIAPVLAMLLHLFLMGLQGEDEPEFLAMSAFVIGILTLIITLLIVFFPWWTLGTIAFIALGIGVYQLGKRVGK